MNYTYLLRCSDNTLYCGWTNDLAKRLTSHNTGTGAKYTRPRTPVTLVYFETFETKEEAMSREAAIKRLSRTEKLRLIKHCDARRLALINAITAESKVVPQNHPHKENTL